MVVTVSSISDTSVSCTTGAFESEDSWSLSDADGVGSLLESVPD